MRSYIDDILHRYGQSAEISSDNFSGTRAVTAFIQPFLRKREDPPVAVTPLGTVSERRWLYLGSADIALCPGDKVHCQQQDFTVQQAEAVFLGKDLLYYWAILRPRKERSV